MTEKIQTCRDAVAQWLRGLWGEPHVMHCAVLLSKINTL